MVCKLKLHGIGVDTETGGRLEAELIEVAGLHLLICSAMLDREEYG